MIQNLQPENFHRLCAPFADIFPQMKRIAKNTLFRPVGAVTVTGIGFILLTTFFPDIFTNAIWAENGQKPGCRRSLISARATIRLHRLTQRLRRFAGLKRRRCAVFDGVQWQRIVLPGGGPATSICSANGKIFVGGSSELGSSAGYARRKHALFLREFIPILQNFKSIGENHCHRQKCIFPQLLRTVPAGTGGKCAFGCRKPCFTRRSQVAMRCLFGKIGLKRSRRRFAAAHSGGEFFTGEGIAGIFRRQMAHSGRSPAFPAGNC